MEAYATYLLLQMLINKIVVAYCEKTCRDMAMLLCQTNYLFLCQCRYSNLCDVVGGITLSV
jgi:hypothetical protein